jgi:pimeloyl-ACP methyl ester carboxylesterase
MSPDRQSAGADHSEGRVLCLNAVGFHSLRYLEWGPPDASRVVLCVHGLTRNAHDFDFLARRLSSQARVVAVDVAGRGESDWLPDPLGYAYPQYVADMATLIARLDAPKVDWIGTSMGGLIGMMIAARPNAPIGRLVINDVGPFIPKAALRRIADYVGLENRFSNLETLERHLRKAYAPFGPLSDAHWAHLASHGHRRLAEGSFGLNYDPRIGVNVAKNVADVDLWALWDQISAPTLVLRGSESDILSGETAAEMSKRGPKATCIEFPGIGHAPALFADDQIAAIEAWLGLG